jgi:anti-sigma regulatory factor (Ser/Thr protein kinase)
MTVETISERARAAAARKQSQALRAQATVLREESGVLAERLFEGMGEPRLRAFGEHGDTFALRVARLPRAVGLLRQELRRWLERREVPPAEVADITLAASEACANAVEHPQASERWAVVDEARRRASDVELSVQDFGIWNEVPLVADRGRGRGLRMMRALMDEVSVDETPLGTRVTMRRRLPGAAS